MEEERFGGEIIAITLKLTYLQTNNFNKEK